MFKTKAFRALMATSVLTAASLAFANPEPPEPASNDNAASDQAEKKSREKIQEEAIERFKKLMEEPPSEEEMEMITLLRKLKDMYINDEKFSSIYSGAIKGAYKAMDPHTDAYNLEEMQKKQEEMRGKLIGIGVTVLTLEKGFIINDILDNSPAFSSGLHVGDIITHVDNKHLVEETTPDEAIRLILGKPDTAVAITVERSGIQMPPVKIIRKAVEFSDIKSYMLDSIGYIKIPSFVHKKTADQFKRAVEDFKKEPVKITGLIIDLRNNGGGSLDDTVAIADMLLDHDDVIVNQVGRTPENSEVYHATPGQITDLPIVVLVNKYSASASELLSVALQDYNRATVIAEEGTYGKGTVQSIYSKFTSNWGMKATIAQYFSPRNYVVQQHGVTAEILVKPLTPPKPNPNYVSEREKPNAVVGGLANIESPPPRVTREWCEIASRKFAPGEIPFSMMDPLTDKPDIVVLCARDHLNRASGLSSARTFTVNSPYTPPAKPDTVAQDRKKLWARPKPD